MERFQTLQDPGRDRRLVADQLPYQRSPQIGVRGNVTLADQVRFDFEAEGNRFDLSDQRAGNNAIASSINGSLAGLPRPAMRHLERRR